MKAVSIIDESQIEKMDLTISFTMSVEEWRALMHEQSGRWPAEALGSKIAETLGHIARATKVRFDK